VTTTHRPFEIGLFTFGEITTDPATGRPLDSAVRPREFVDLARIADDAGLDVFGVGEHHRPDFAIASPPVVLAAIAQATERKILWEHDLLGHDRFLAQIGLGGLPFADTARSIELLATAVLPVVRREASAQTKAVA
jgi:hypothetical protein